MPGPPIDHAKLPYQPRRRNTPSRPLPPPPPGEEHGEDVEATEAFEEAQAFTSPPSPPRPAAPVSAPRLRPPPPITTRTGTTGAKTSPSHLNPYRSTLPEGLTPPTTLTPLRAHYLKKTLVNLQMSHELTLLTDPVLGANSLGLLGDPFVLTEAAKRDALARISEMARQEGRLGDLPFMRFLFHQFLLPFPFLSTAPPTFWSSKVQPFLSSFLSTTGYTKQTGMSVEEQKMSDSLMSPEEKKELDERNKLWVKSEKHLALMVGVGIKIVGGEEVVRIGQSELRRLEEAQEERRRKRREKDQARFAPPPPPNGGASGSGTGAGAEAPPPPPTAAQLFDVNVVGIRVVTEKGRVRNKSHDEFLIRTRTGFSDDIYVSRRYGDFKRLADELRLAFPEDPLPPPPPKDKSAMASPAAPPPAQYGTYNPLRAIYGSNPPSSSSSPRPGSPSLNNDEPPLSPITNTSPLSREKNRLTLRAYLQRILDFPHVLNSPILRSFLLSKPTTLTREEAMDSQRRLEGDAVREEGRRRFREEAQKRIEDLREGLAQFKGDVLSSDGGLQKVFDVVRRVEKVEDLPPAEMSVLIWGRISLAATIFQVFVAADTASDSLTQLKRLHGLMPYFVLKGILRISNPMAMIRGVLDLFLARPFGGQSLLQRMFSSSLTEDVRLLAEDIALVADKIDDPVLCQKIAQYATAPYEIQEIYRRDAAAEGLDLLVVILRSPDPPSLSRPQFQRVFKAARAYKEYKASLEDVEDSDDDMGPEDEDAWLFEDLGLLLKLWMRKREKEQLVSLIFEGVTAELLKDIITIFYAPLAQVYKAASIADSLSDLQNFLNDMIRTVEQVEELSAEDPQRTVQTFIDLVQRHEQSFYTFVHNVHSKGQGLFDSLMAWIELFLNYARDGLHQPIDLEFILPHGGPEREAIMAEVDAVAQYHYKLKLAHEEKVRRRFDRATNAEASEEAALLGSVMATLSLSETAVGEAKELGDENSEEEDEDEDEEDDDESFSLESDSVRSVPPGPTPVTAPVAPRQSSSTPPVSAESSRSSIPLVGVSEKPASASASATASPAGSGSRLSLPDETRTRTRRDSNHSGRSSLDKIRATLPGRKKSPDVTQQGHGQGKDKKPPPGPVRVVHGPVPGAKGTATSRKEARKRARMMASLQPPDTSAVNELRPLFVEVLRPLLVPKPLKKLPPVAPVQTMSPSRPGQAGR